MFQNALIILFLQSKHEHYHLFCFNLPEEVIKNFEALPKAANGSGSYVVKYRHASFDHVKKSCEIYLHFTEQANHNRLIQFLESAGASQVMTVPLDKNSKKYALKSVIKLGQKTNVTFSYGVVHKDLEYLFTKSTYQFCKRTFGGHENNEGESEFDVVKKRRLIDSSTGEGETDPEALVRFEDFELNTLPALLEIHANDLVQRAIEVAEFEDDVFNGKQPPLGGVYFARSKVIPALKIGATRRSDPNLRLKELSRSVPAPFELVAWIPTDRPFKLERSVHEHFKAHRILTKGACTEFFQIDDSAVLSFVNGDAF